jgi:hypothetical protein
MFLVFGNRRSAGELASTMVAIRRFLSLPGESLLGPTEVVIELQQCAVASVALELALLLAGLVESLRLRPSAGPTILLTLIDNDRIAKAVVAHCPDRTVSFALGRNQAEFLQAVLLRAYRDQMAEINHVHIEGERDGTAFDLTVLFDVYRAPMSADEAAKLLAD